jgi:divalent metal cation (Fe/Co/Zn/Cd) transporter
MQKEIIIKNHELEIQFNDDRIDSICLDLGSCEELTVSDLLEFANSVEQQVKKLFKQENQIEVNDEGVVAEYNEDTGELIVINHQDQKNLFQCIYV